MPVTPTNFYPQSIQTVGQTIVNADASAKKTLYTAGTNGSKIESIMVTNTDTAAYTLNIYVTVSGTDYLVGTVSIPISAGNTTAAPTVNLLNMANFTLTNKDAQGNNYIYLLGGALLKVASTTTVTSGKTLTFLSIGEDF